MTSDLCWIDDAYDRRDRDEYEGSGDADDNIGRDVPDDVANDRVRTPSCERHVARVRA